MYFKQASVHVAYMYVWERVGYEGKHTFTTGACMKQIQMILNRKEFSKSPQNVRIYTDCRHPYRRWFKYDRDYLCVNKSQFVPVIFEPPCKYKRTNLPQTVVHKVSSAIFIFYYCHNYNFYYGCCANTF
jgi:hypothetical protein